MSKISQKLGMKKILSDFKFETQKTSLAASAALQKFNLNLFATTFKIIIVNRMN